MAELIYPTLDLFLYDLRNGLGETVAEIEQNRAYFQQKLPEEVRDLIYLQDLHFEAEYEDLLPDRIFPFSTLIETCTLEGYYYPVRLNDTYGLLLDSSVDNLTDPQPIDCFRFLKTAIEKCLQGQIATIGQTWMLSGWLPENPTHSAEEIAQACYETFLPKGNWRQDLEGQGQLLGAACFELWRYRSTLQEGETATDTVQSLQQNRHVLILIFPNQTTMAKAADLYYDDWLRLLSFRNKILWAYSQSRAIKQLIKTDFAVVQASHRRSQTFDEFRETLIRIQDALNHYKMNLIQLDFQGRTIDINLRNYQKRLQRILVQGVPETDLAFLEAFVEVVEGKYLLQITKDSKNMQLGLRLLEDAINATQSRLEVEKAERDRNFQRVIQYLGVGWATATVTAEHIDEKFDPFNWQDLEPTWVASLSPLIYVLLITGMVAGLSALIIPAGKGFRKLWDTLRQL